MKVEIVREENHNLGVPGQRQEVGNSSSDINEAIALARQLNTDNPGLVHQVIITP